ncbi:MAG: AAA family ATPase [Chloroflexi bacterium]|nr:AAA family ATPase [Chloroflexota bacterium]MCL5076108.1 AAA family ATPase [Chloroflexota bacterium]
MTTTIAVAGKGGTGKTTIAGLLIRYIRENNLGTVLAIDADPSSNLNIILNLPLDNTVGDMREELLNKVKTGSAALGMSKQDYVEYKINESLVEGEGIDLLAMGRPEGPGCYCAANNWLRICIDRLEAGYNYVVIDNEAGLEHLSRRTTRDVDLLLIVSDPTQRGLLTAVRIVDLVKELQTNVGAVYLIINRLNGDLPEPLQQIIASIRVELIGTIPDDPTIAAFEATGRPLIELPAESIAYKSIRQIASRMRLAPDRVIPETLAKSH